MSRTDGLILLAKPAGITSFQALTPIKRLLPGTKVGHSGTLDRFAEGLLLVVCGRMTRLVPLLTGLDKEYIAEVQFGSETTTLDPEGEVVAEADPPRLGALEKTLPAFRGEIEQIPPQYSAVHVGGERAHRAARAGRTLAIAPRRVTIHALELLDFRETTARLRVACSSGTYVRALARDIARACGSRAHLRALERTRIGSFELRDAVQHDELRLDRDLKGWSESLACLPSVAQVRVDDDTAALIGRGGLLTARHFRPGLPTAPRIAVYDRQDRFLALVEQKEGRFRYHFVAAPATR